MFSGNFLKFLGVFLVIMLADGGGFFVWERYLSPQAKLNLEAQANYQKYLDWEDNYEKAMREDTYGGKTPQETLDMFVAALRAGDVELASKYFMLDDGLKREKWVAMLADIKQRGFLMQMANDIENKAILGDISNDDESGYLLYNGDGTVGVQIDLRLNK